MPLSHCLVCSQEFYAKPSHIKRGWGKYCSKQCQYSAQKTGKQLHCFVCGGAVYRSLKDQLNSKSQRFFCNKSCQTVWRNSTVFIGDKHGNWNGGTASYKQILLRAGAQQICARCRCVDKRVLAVHHKDRDRKNNHVSNLVWLCHNCHYLVHHFKSEAKNFMVAVA